jgi:arylsulfatase
MTEHTDTVRESTGELENRKQPNVLLIVTDHWSGSSLGVAGHPVLQTPTLDELSRQGVLYERAYSECPVCIPARRTLMTGTEARTHGDRIFSEEMEMPRVPTLAQVFRNAGYQAYGVGKLHVYPQRDRIGFDDVILCEEGRAQWGVVDDYELFLGDRGYPGRQFDHGMCNNQYVARSWHLPEDTHATNFVADRMCRTIKRRDSKRPSLWYMGFTHPHPPLTPPSEYLEMYRHMVVNMPHTGYWAQEPEHLPYKLRQNYQMGMSMSDYAISDARRAHYALCTHIDHQIRRVIGTLREEGELDNTIIMFTSDHGDMLGNHGLWAKRCFLESSARVPMILTGTTLGDRIERGSVSTQLVGLQDVMPTLLDACGIEAPESVEGRSMLAAGKREYLYGEEGEDHSATRMIHDGRYKLIYYAVGNKFQLFDVEKDPEELNDLFDSSSIREKRIELEQELISRLHGSDSGWIADGRLTGLPDREYPLVPKPGLAGQRGTHWPPPPENGLKIQL